MSLTATECWLLSEDEPRTLEDYQGGTSRWCTGCGDNAILSALQRLCRDEGLPQEKIVFVSGIGCSSRLPHYMNTYGFHGLHGRALPVAEGIKIRRPDLHVFVATGDGDCCSIGAAHWIHAIRYNMDMTVVMHDNQTYGLTKHQVSPTSSLGLRTNTSPRGAPLNPLNPLTVTLGVTNVSFVAQMVDWIPELFSQVLTLAFRHRGFAFIRVVQRCPEYLPALLDPWIESPERVMLLTHEDGLQPSAGLARSYPNRPIHDPSDLAAAREIAAVTGQIPVGVLYRNDAVPCYEDLRASNGPMGPPEMQKRLEAELDRFTVWPDGSRSEGSE